METTLFFEYIWVLIVLILLEGLLAADNAIVMAVMVKPLSEIEQKKALFYGLLGAFVFRFSSLFAISYFVNLWEIQAIGAIYLLSISFFNIYKNSIKMRVQIQKSPLQKKKLEKKTKLWISIIKVEIADMAFAVDSLLAAVALAVTLPRTNFPKIGAIDGGQFIVILLGGLIGLTIMRFAASFFVTLLKRKPGLELSAFMIVGWVGVKLAVYTISHPEIGLLTEEFTKSIGWKVTFYLVLIIIAAAGWIFSKDKNTLKNSDN